MCTSLSKLHKTKSFVDWQFAIILKFDFEATQAFVASHPPPPPHHYHAVIKVYLINGLRSCKCKWSLCTNSAELSLFSRTFPLYCSSSLKSIPTKMNEDLNKCCGPVNISFGSGSAHPWSWIFDQDPRANYLRILPDPDMAIGKICCQKSSKSLNILKY